METPVETTATVESINAPVEIIMYTKTVCPRCTGVKSYLKTKGMLEGVAYRTINVDHDADALARIKEQGFLQAPVLEWTGGAAFSGFDPGKLDEVAAAYKSHELVGAGALVGAAA